MHTIYIIIDINKIKKILVLVAVLLCTGAVFAQSNTNKKTATKKNTQQESSIYQENVNYNDVAPETGVFYDNSSEIYETREAIDKRKKEEAKKRMEAMGNKTYKSKYKSKYTKQAQTTKKK